MTPEGFVPAEADETGLSIAEERNMHDFQVIHVDEPNERFQVDFSEDESAVDFPG